MMWWGLGCAVLVVSSVFGLGGCEEEQGTTSTGSTSSQSSGVGGSGGSGGIASGGNGGIGAGPSAGGGGQGGEGGSSSGGSAPGWSKTFGDGSEEAITSVAVDGSGAVIAAGWFEGDIDLGGGKLSSKARDLFVAKFDATGKSLWSRQFGGDGTDSLANIALDSKGDVLIAGNFADGITLNSKSYNGAGLFLSKLDGSTGDEVWANGFIEDATVNGLSVNASDHPVIIGTFALNFAVCPAPAIPCSELSSPFGSNTFLIEFTADGVHEWSKDISSHVSSVSYLKVDKVATGSENVLAVAGPIGGGDIVSNCGFVPIKNSSQHFAIQTRDGVGNATWCERMYDHTELVSSKNTVHALAVDDADGLSFAGRFTLGLDLGGGDLTYAGGDDMFVAKLDKDGAHTWSKSFGDAADQVLYALGHDSSGAVLAAGSCAGDVDFGGPTVLAGDPSGSACVVKLAAGDGSHIWSRAYGGAAAVLGVASSGPGVVLAGRFSGSIDFGHGEFDSAGVDDAFLAFVLP